MAQSGDGEAVHLLNVTAAVIWELCDGAHTAEEIADEVARRTGAGLERVSQDVRAALSDLRERGMLE